MATVNGREYQHATIDLQITIAPGSPSFAFSTFSKLSYKITAEKKPVMNQQGKVIGYTIDNQKNDASVSLLLSEWFAFKDFVRGQESVLGVGQIEFDFTVTYGSSISGLRTDRLVGAMFNEESRSSENNQDSLYIDLPLFVADVVPDGGPFINYGAPAR